MTLKIRRPTQVKRLRAPIVLRPGGAAKAAGPCRDELTALLNCWRNFGVDSDSCWDKARLMTECAEMARLAKKEDTSGEINHWLRELPRGRNSIV